MKNELTHTQIDQCWDSHVNRYGRSRYDIARAIIAAHEALQAGQEPVAWRVRYRSPPEMLGHYPWSYTERKPKLPSDTTREVESVYAAPQPAPDKDAEIERLNKKARAYKALTESLEGRISIYASRAEQSQEAIKTLASERQANMMLTAEVAMRDAEIVALRKELANAKKLIVDVYAMLPEQSIAARHAIDKGTGNWFVWGVDRSATTDIAQAEQPTTP